MEFIPVLKQKEMDTWVILLQYFKEIIENIFKKAMIVTVLYYYCVLSHIHFVVMIPASGCLYLPQASTN